MLFRSMISVISITGRDSEVWVEFSIICKCDYKGTRRPGTRALLGAMLWLIGFWWARTLSALGRLLDSRIILTGEDDKSQRYLLRKNTFGKTNRSGPKAAPVAFPALLHLRRRPRLRSALGACTICRRTTRSTPIPVATLAVAAISAPGT